MSTPNLDHFTREDFEDIYEPAEDTFLFLDALEKEKEFLFALKPAIALEVGPGSGCIITFLANMFRKCGEVCHFMAIDINLKACEATLRTALQNNVQVETINGDLFSSCKLQQAIDIILFNPPYVPTDSEEVGSCGIDAAWAGGESGREVIDQFLPCINDVLSENGVLYLLLERLNKPLEVIEMMKGMGFTNRVVMKRRARNEELYIIKFTRTK